MPINPSNSLVSFMFSLSEKCLQGFEVSISVFFPHWRPLVPNYIWPLYWQWRTLNAIRNLNFIPFHCYKRMSLPAFVRTFFLVFATAKFCRKSYNINERQNWRRPVCSFPAKITQIHLHALQCFPAKIKRVNLATCHRYYIYQGCPV